MQYLNAIVGSYYVCINYYSFFCDIIDSLWKEAWSILNIDYMDIYEFEFVDCWVHVLGMLIFGRFDWIR
jgi:hypothetical protein